MPALTNHKHELFAQGMVAGKKPPVAYMEAGYDVKESAADAAASRLLKNVKVLNRIEELQNSVAKKFIKDTVITKEKVVKKLIELAEEAREEGQFSVASNNWIKLGTDIGMFVTKSESTVNLKKDPSEYTDEELAAIMSGLSEDESQIAH